MAKQHGKFNLLDEAVCNVGENRTIPLSQQNSGRVTIPGGL